MNERTNELNVCYCVNWARQEEEEEVEQAKDELSTPLLLRVRKRFLVSLQFRNVLMSKN